MILNIIHDNRRFERFDPLMKELIRQQVFAYQIWEPVAANTVVESINRSHKQIVQWAKDMKLPRVLVGEDDLYFPAEDGFEHFMREMPSSFDMYLGCSYIKDGSKFQICGFHFYVMDERFYDRFLALPDNLHIDTATSNLGGDFKFCYPFPVLQRAGFSANNKADVDYNKILQPKDIYQ